MKLMYFKSCHPYGRSITPYATGIANAQTKPTNSPKSARSKFVADGKTVNPQQLLG